MAILYLNAAVHIAEQVLAHQAPHPLVRRRGEDERVGVHAERRQSDWDRFVNSETYTFLQTFLAVLESKIASCSLPWIPERRCAVRTSARLRVSRRRKTRRWRRQLMEVLGGVELVERRHRARGEAAPPSLRRGREHLGLLGGGIKKKVGKGLENRNSFND